MKKIVLLLVLALTVSAQAAIVYNPYTDIAYQDSSNPNGQWSFGRSTDLTQASFVLNQTFFDGGVNNVYMSEVGPIIPGLAGGYPFVWVNYAHSDGFYVPGDTVLQAGVDKPTENAVIRWTAPAAGLIDIDATIIYGAGSETASILHNDTTLFQTPGVGDTYAVTNLAVAAGDTIDVALAGTQPVASTIRLLETITFEVPEPATIGLLSMGALALLRKRR